MALDRLEIEAVVEEVANMIFGGHLDVALARAVVDLSFVFVYKTGDDFQLKIRSQDRCISRGAVCSDCCDYLSCVLNDL